MEAKEARIQRVLEGNRQFLVPHFQRPYSWTAKQWDALWRDLMDLVEAPAAEPHFVGSFVTSPGRTVPEGVEKRLIIDGQQRLTTIVVLLAVVRDRAHDTGAARLAERIHDLITNRHEDGLDHYKLLPTQGDSAADSDREALTALVDRRPLASTSGIARAAEHLRAKLIRSDAPSLDELYRATTARLTLVSVILDDKDNPHRIFESLNGKGRPLNQADLIRNYFFMRLPAEQHERVYRAQWQPMQRRLGEEALTEFVRHYLMSQGSVVNEGDVYTTLKHRMESSDRSVEEELALLCELAGYYQVLLDPAHAPSVAVRERLERLRRLEVTVVLPFILPVYADFARGQLAERDLCAVLDMVETFVVRRFVCGLATSGLNKVFTPFYAQVSRSPSLVDATALTLSRRGCPTDTQFRERLATAQLYGGGDRRARTKLLLERLERASGHKEQVALEPLSIEHVLPQSPSEWWQAALGEDWDEVHDELVHTLGNLTLTHYNSELSNEDYAHKQSLFAQSHVELNRYFASAPRWDAEAIARRADVLADLALTVWPWFGPTAETTTSDATVDVTSTLPKAVVFRGREVPVRTWAEVLTTTLDLLHEAAPDQSVVLEEALSRVVRRDPTTFRNPRRIRRLTSGAYVESNLSAAAIHRTCLRALAALGFEASDWDVTRISGLDSGADEETEAPSDIKLLQAEWWTQLRSALETTGAFSSLRPARPQHHYDIAIGRSGFRITLIAHVLQARLEVRLLDESATPVMAQLLADRASIEDQIGSTLEWELSDEIRRRTVRVGRALHFQDRDQWPEALAWATRMAVAFKRVFAPRIAGAEAQLDP